MCDKLTIAVDFDGVIHGHSQGWHDGTIYDPPVPGVAAALAELRKRFRVIIFSCRTNGPSEAFPQPNQHAEMVKYLQKHGILYDEIYIGPGKPVAYLYIDDRAIQFRGDWKDTLHEVATFRLWNL